MLPRVHDSLCGRFQQRNSTGEVSFNWVINSKTNPYVFQDTSFFSEYIVVVGVLISTASSALGAVFGGSRILQALARDKLLPGIGILGYGSPKGKYFFPAFRIYTWLI